MVTVTKQFSFDCAHMLTGHKGLCQNVHGHTYKLEVEVKSTSIAGVSDLIGIGPSEGMIVDFSDLKTVVKRVIVDKYDHAFIGWANAEGCEEEIISTLIRYGKKVVVNHYRPTAENMAIDFFQLLQSALSDLGLTVVAVRVWETPTSTATVTK